MFTVSLKRIGPILYLKIVLKKHTYINESDVGKHTRWRWVNQQLECGGFLQGSYCRSLLGDAVPPLLLVSICSVGNSHFQLLNQSSSFFFPCQLPDSHGRKKGVMFSFQHPSPSSLLLWKMKQASYFCYSSFPSASFLQDLSLSWIIPVPILVPSSSFFKLHLRGCWVFPAQHGALLEHRLGSW